MGLDYFKGYETMVFVLALVAYFVLPLGVTFAVRKRYGGLWYLAAGILVAFFVIELFRAVFGFLFDRAELGNIFIWPWQMAATCAMLAMVLLYDLRECLGGRTWMRRSSYFLIGAASGWCVFVGAIVFLDFVFSMNVRGRHPHLGPAMLLYSLALPAFYLAAGFVACKILIQGGTAKWKAIMGYLLISAGVFGISPLLMYMIWLWD